MSFLFGATIAVNLLALFLTIWLGLYLVSRSPRYLISWLTAIALWLMSSIFFNTLLAIYPPPFIQIQPFWLHYFFPFWPTDALSGANNIWLQGWSIAPALALWHHVSILLLQEKNTTWRLVRISFGYVLGMVAVIVQKTAPLSYSPERNTQLFLNHLNAGPWYPLFTVTLVILTWLCVLNLVLAARAAPSHIAGKQINVLVWATLAGGVAGFISIPGSYLGIPIPILVISVLQATMVALIGWGVARYSALMEGRTTQKDFAYSLFLLSLVLVIYLPISWILIDTYHAPLVSLIAFPAIAVITHSSMTAIDHLRDRIFYSQETRLLRTQLRRLSRQVGVSAPLEDLLRPPLETLCDSMDATYGLIIVFEDHTARKLISQHIYGEIPNMELKKLAADDVIKLAANHLPTPLDKAALLVPMYGEVDQLGALVLGQPKNGLQYAAEDIEPILEFAYQISETIQNANRNLKYLAQIADLVKSQSQLHIHTVPPISADCIEEALRNLDDYSELADNPLAELSLVQSSLPKSQVTHLERGKAVHAVLHEAIGKLRPTATPPSNPPGREWYSYLILQEAYIEGTSNRDIMQKLYISEGTFNRTRRTAIRSLARAIGEMEASAQ